MPAAVRGAQGDRGGRRVQGNRKRTNIHCPICLQKILFQQIVATQCGHVYCRGCIREILKNRVNRRCPVCREDLLDFAKTMGADETMLVKPGDNEAALVARTHQLLGDHPDCTIDASGAQATVRLAMLATKSGGTAVLVGMGNPEATVPIAGAMSREVDIRGIVRYANELDFAKTMGADETMLVKPGDNEAALVARTHQLLGDHPDCTIDASGAQATVRLAMLATKSGGTAVLVGMGNPEATVPIAGAMSREVDIRGIVRYAKEYPIALAMVASGKINVKPLVTHHLTLEETLEAYETSRKGAGIKVMIHMQPRDGK